jgi:threonine dehydratase
MKGMAQDKQIILPNFSFRTQLIDDVPDVDVVVVPVGGAGLIAGVSCAVKTLKPECKVRRQAFG